MIELRRVARHLRPYPFEIVAVGMALLAFAYLRWNGLRYGWNTVAYTFPPLIRPLPQLLGWGVALQALVSLVSRRSATDYLRGVLRLRWFAVWCRAWFAAMLFIYAYSWLKVSVPLVRTTVLYDPQLWRLDRWLHFGFSPSVFAIELVAGTRLASWLDNWYLLWIPSVMVIIAYLFAAKEEQRVRNVALAIIVLWTLGAWIYQLVPAVGPCYATPDILDPIRAQIPNAISRQAMLWSNYSQMVSGRSGALKSFQPHFGVAAMPSLHVGLHALVFFWALRHERWLVVPGLVATLLTFFGSVVTGWHYAVDGYAGLLLAWFAVWAADRLEPIPDGASTGEVESSPAPAGVSA